MSVHSVVNRDAVRALEQVAWLQKGLREGLYPFARNRHFAIHYDPSCRFLYVQRTPLPFESSDDLVSSFEEVESHLSSIARKDTAFLGDTRGGPSRNDPRYEATMVKVRGKLLGGYRVAATLTATVAGQLQIRRYAHQDNRTTLVTSDIGEAFAYLALPRHILPPLVENEDAFWAQRTSFSESGKSKCQTVSATRAAEGRNHLFDSLLPE